jgi:hypothetical protein
VEGTGERSVNPWNDPRRVAHPEGMREIDLLYSSIISHPFRMQIHMTYPPGIYAALQSLATLSNPFGVIGLNSMLLP